jgi:hypothetical protein
MYIKTRRLVYLIIVEAVIYGYLKQLIGLFWGGNDFRKTFISTYGDDVDLHVSFRARKTARLRVTSFTKSRLE